MKIVNCTPHNIDIVNSESVVFDKATRKFLATADTKIVETHAPSGKVLDCQESQEFETKIGSTTIMRTTLSVAQDQQPLNEPNTLYIVSQKYVSACRCNGLDTSQLLTIGNGVFKLPTDSRPLGARHLEIN